jgi:hypothetical protein
MLDRRNGKNGSFSLVVDEELNSLAPYAATNAAISLYGSKAPLAAAWCAFSAQCEGREDDFHFWLRVFKLLLNRRLKPDIE